MYTISYDERARVLTIVLESFWNFTTHARFLAEASARGIALLLKHGRFAVFVDCSNYSVQSGSLVEGFAPLIGRATKRGVPIALLLATRLNRMQAERTLGATGIGLFVDRAEALAWLEEQIGKRTANRAA